MPDRQQMLAALERKRKLPQGSVADPYSLASITSRLDPSTLDVADAPEEPKAPPERVPFSADMQPETSDLPKPLSPSGPGMLAREPQPVQDFAAYTPPEPVAPTKTEWGTTPPPSLAEEGEEESG